MKISLPFLKMKSFRDKQQEVFFFVIVLQLPALCSHNQILETNHTHTHSHTLITHAGWRMLGNLTPTRQGQSLDVVRMNGSQCGVFINITFVCLCVCRTVKITQRVIGANAALRDSTVWSEVSMTTVNPAPVRSPTQRTSKLSVFVHLFFFFWWWVSTNRKHHASIMYDVVIFVCHSLKHIYLHFCYFCSIFYMCTVK